MAKLTEIRTDLEKVEKGVWVDFLADIKLCIASVNNPNYKQHRSRLLKPHLRRIRGNQMSQDEILDVVKPAIAKHILVDWKNLEDESGKPIKYSSDKALDLFMDKELSSLFDFVIETMGDSELFRLECLDEAEKN